MRGVDAAAAEMRPWEKILAATGICLVLLGAVLINRSPLSARDLLISSGPCHTPATVLDPPAGVHAAGSVIVLHGLGANRRTMTYLGSDFAGHGFRAYLLDLPGHGDNTDAFTFAKAQECADRTVASLLREGVLDARSTVLLGHSMGAAIAIRMADVEPLAATIALSPAPMIPPRRMPSNLLVFSGQYDLSILRRQAEALAAEAGGERTSPEDFAQQRAFDLQTLPHATHTSPLVDRGVAHRAEQWAMQALYPSVDPRTIALNLDLATYGFNRGRFEVTGALLGLLGLFFLFPASATLAGILVPPTSLSDTSELAPATMTILQGGVCALLAVLILRLFVPLRFLHLYNGDYLASLMLLWGASMLALNWKYAKASFLPPGKAHGKAASAGTLLAFGVSLALGAWLNWHLGDLWLNGPRWLRFAALLPVGWIFCFAEEVVLGPVAAGKERLLRFWTFLLLRLALWLACVLAYYMLNNGQVLIGVLVAGLATFSIVQRIATDAVRRRTRSATAAAAFGAILAAWFIAAVFPLR